MVMKEMNTLVAVDSFLAAWNESQPRKGIVPYEQCLLIPSIVECQLRIGARSLAGDDADVSAQGIRLHELQGA